MLPVRRTATPPHVRRTVARAGVVLTVTLAFCLGGSALWTAFRVLNERADRNASLEYLDLVYGNLNGEPNAIRDPRVVEKAVELIPPSATYGVVIGPRWKPLRQLRWTTSLERDFLRYYLLPREQVEPPSRTRWVVCLGCDLQALGRTRVLSRGSDGMMLVRRSR